MISVGRARRQRLFLLLRLRPSGRARRDACALGLLAAAGELVQDLVTALVVVSDLVQDEEVLQHHPHILEAVRHADAPRALHRIGRQRALVHVVQVEQAAVGQILHPRQVRGVRAVVADVKRVVVHLTPRRSRGQTFMSGAPLRRLVAESFSQGADQAKLRLTLGATEGQEDVASDL